MQMNERGYLFFRGIVPVEEVMAVRRDVLGQCRQAGWLDPSRDLMEAVAAPGIEPKTEGQRAYSEVYRKVLHLPRFHDFPCQPTLMALAQCLLGAEVLVHPRRIGGLSFPRILSPPRRRIRTTTIFAAPLRPTRAGRRWGTVRPG